MDYTKGFIQSCQLLYKQKSLLVPSIFAIAILFGCILAFVHGSGIRTYGMWHNQQLEAFEAANPVSGNWFTQMNEENKRSVAFNEFLKEQGQEEQIKALWNWTFAWNLIVYGLIAILAGIYATAATFIATKDAMTGHDVDWPGVLGETTRKFIPFTFLLIVLCLIVGAPLIIGVGVVFAAFTVHPALGVLAALAGLLVYVCFMVYAMTKLNFVEPAFFFKPAKSGSSFKHSWRLTNGYFKEAFIIAIIAGGISVLVSSFSSPLEEAIVTFVFGNNQAVSAILIVTGLLCAAIYAIGSALRIVYLSVAYKQFVKEHGRN